MKSVYLRLGALFVPVCLGACTSAKFTGENGTREGLVNPPAATASPAPGGESLAFTCGGPSAQSLSAHVGDQVTVTGQLCPAAAAQAAVLFVVDNSGSVGKHSESSGGPEQPGTDPETGGSCGRLAAAQAVLAQLGQGASAPGAEVQVGLIPFASDVLASHVVSLMPLSQFRQLVDAAHFCTYVVQDPASDGVDPQNPGGLDGSLDGVNAGTDYQAAFAAADAMLQGIQGNKTVFFISDGAPTYPGDGSTTGPEAVQASVAAGQQLQQDVPGLTLDSVLLQNPDLGPAAQQILAQVAGSPSRVAIAANASQLASTILQFAAAAIDPSSVQAEISLAGAAPVALALASFTKLADGAYQWVTQAFPAAFGADTLIEVSAVTTAGTPVEAKATLQTTRL